MTQNNYVVELHGGEKATVTCDVVGVSQTGDLIAFNNINGQSIAIEGFALGTWKRFKLSTVQLRAV